MLFRLNNGLILVHKAEDAFNGLINVAPKKTTYLKYIQRLYPKYKYQDATFQILS